MRSLCLAAAPSCAMTYCCAMLILLLAPPAVLPAAVPPVVSWTFDEARETGAVQPARERLDSLQGAIEFAPGERGSGFKFDGFTSRLVRAARDLPQFGPALTVEAWIAPQEYSWAWTGIVNHDQDARAGFFLGIDQVMNLKSKQRHFVIGETGAHWKPFGFGVREGFSTMPCWNHWPVAQLPNDGRVTPVADRPSSTCLGTLFPVKHKTDRPDLMLGRNLYGMTGKPPRELAVLARSWNFPAELRLAGSAFERLGYDKNQRAYVLARKPAVENAALAFTLAGNSKSPVLNPAFIVKHWGNANVRLTLEGKPVPRGKGFRFGHRQTLEGTDLIVWIEAGSQASLSFRFEPQPEQ